MTQPAPLAFLDCETTGLDPRVHEVWEIGLIRRDPDGSQDEHLWQIRPDLDRADTEALNVNRFADRFIDLDGFDGVEIVKGEAWGFALADLLFDFQGAVRGCRLVAANPSFDDAFLKALLQPHGRRIGWHYRLVCVESMAAGKLGWPVTRSLKESAAALGVDLPDEEHHTALGDARAVMRLYDAITGGASAVTP